MGLSEPKRFIKFGLQKQTFSNNERGKDSLLSLDKLLMAFTGI